VGAQLGRHRRSCFFIVRGLYSVTALRENDKTVNFFLLLVGFKGSFNPPLSPCRINTKSKHQPKRLQPLVSVKTTSFV